MISNLENILSKIKMKTILYVGAILALLIFAVAAYAQEVTTQCIQPGKDLDKFVCKKGFKFVVEASKDGKKFDETDTFETNENVYVWGFNVGGNADIYVTEDRNWNDGDPIGTYVTKKSNKDIEGKFVNLGKFAPGNYDIVVDRNKNGKFDQNCDAIDSSSVIGFEVLPEAATLGLFAIGLVSMGGYFSIRKKEVI